MPPKTRHLLSSEVFNRTDSLSQFGQETFVCDLIFPDRMGYYVDVGARCGVISSNTHLLERLGWQGVCIEPNPDNFDNLVTARPNAICLQLAASNRREKARFMSIASHGPSGRSGLVDTYRASDLERMRNQDHVLIDVQTAPLTEILDKVAAPRNIEYLDVDVEGHERHVLEGIDFERYSFGVIGVETRTGFEDHDWIVAHLAEAGYRPVALLGADTMFMPRR